MSTPTPEASVPTTDTTVRLDHATMTVEVMVCTTCWLNAEDIPGIKYGWQTSARATMQFFPRVPGVLYVTPHKDDCTELEPIDPGQWKW